MNILVINGHQKTGSAEGRLSKTIDELIKQELKEHSIDFSYVDKKYDPEQEVQKMVNADLIIYNFPIFWMGAPWKFKKYLDEVLSSGGGHLFKHDGRTREDGDASNYGKGGLMGDKRFKIISSMNAPEGSFGDSSFFKGNFDSLVKWLILNNNWIGIEKQESSFVFYDVHKNPTVEIQMKELQKELKNIF